jgi:hypothetical protein
MPRQIKSYSSHTHNNTKENRLLHLIGPLFAVSVAVFSSTAETAGIEYEAGIRGIQGVKNIVMGDCMCELNV